MRCRDMAVQEGMGQAEPPAWGSKIPLRLSLIEFNLIEVEACVQACHNCDTCPAVTRAPVFTMPPAQACIRHRLSHRNIQRSSSDRCALCSRLTRPHVRLCVCVCVCASLMITRFHTGRPGTGQDACEGAREQRRRTSANEASCENGPSRISCSEALRLSSVSMRVASFSTSLTSAEPVARIQPWNALRRSGPRFTRPAYVDETQDH